MIKIGFPNLGFYHAAFRHCFERAGCEVLTAPTTQGALDRACRVSPADMCFPFKTTLANIFDLIDEGAELLVMFDSCGSCRYTFYGRLHNDIVREVGRPVSFSSITGTNLFHLLGRLGGLSKLQVIKVLRHTYTRIRAVELAEDLAWRCRPRERVPGSTARALRRAVSLVAQAPSTEGLEEDVKKCFEPLETDPQRQVLRVGIVGEIYTILDSFANRGIDDLLGSLGVEVHKELRISAFIIERVEKRWWFPPWKRRRHQRGPNGYLDEPIGGHARASVADSVAMARRGLDGVIHITPFACMPEVMVRPILRRVTGDLNIPILSLSFDEQTQRAALETRLQAFKDILLQRKGWALV